MALQALQKLLKKSPPPSRIFACLHDPQLHSPNPTKPFLVNSQLDTRPNETNTINAGTFLGSFKADNLTFFDPWLFSPISSLQFCSYSILSSGSIQDGPNEEDESGMWADSVKKKRKRKMNKHKYRKLKKLLRRQT